MMDFTLKSKFSFFGFLDAPFPVLVGNNRVYDRCGCELVITSQEIALLHLPHSVLEGTPPRRRWSSYLLTPSLLDGVREVEQSPFDPFPPGWSPGGRSNVRMTKSILT